METNNFFTLIGIALAVMLSIVLLIITLMARWQVRKTAQGSTEIITLGKNSRGAFVYRWGLIMAGLAGSLAGPSIALYILMLAAVISEQLVVYRTFRPNDKLGKFLTKLNW